MEEFLQQKSISFERVEMNWYEKANEDGHVEDDGLPDEEDDGPVVPPRDLGLQPLPPKHKGKGKDKPNPFQITPVVPSSAAGSSGETVTLSVSALDLILDTIERARTGVEHARSILERGAEAFNGEKKNLDQASEMISAIKRRR